MDRQEIKGKKLKSALRDNLKKRKSQARKLDGEEKDFSIKLRTREIIKKPISEDK